MPKPATIYLTDETVWAFLRALAAEPNERLKQAARDFEEIGGTGNVAAADALMGIFGLVRVHPTDEELEARRG